MKDKIFSVAKTKFAALGLPDDILKNTAEYLASSVNDESGIETALIGVEPLLKSYQREADKIRNNSAKVKNETKTTPKVPLADETTTKTESSEPIPASETIPAWAKALSDTLTAVANEVKVMKGEKVSSSRKAVLDGLTANLPESLKKSYSFIDYSSMTDEEFGNLTASVKENVESVAKEIGIKGGIFKSPMEARSHKDKDGRSEKEIKSLVGGMFKSKK